MTTPRISIAAAGKLVLALAVTAIMHAPAVGAPPTLDLTAGMTVQRYVSPPLADGVHPNKLGYKGQTECSKLGHAMRGELRIPKKPSASFRVDKATKVHLSVFLSGKRPDSSWLGHRCLLVSKRGGGFMNLAAKSPGHLLQLNEGEWDIFVGDTLYNNNLAKTSQTFDIRFVDVTVKPRAAASYAIDSAAQNPHILTFKKHLKHRVNSNIFAGKWNKLMTFQPQLTLDVAAEVRGKLWLRAGYILRTPDGRIHKVKPNQNMADTGVHVETWAKGRHDIWLLGDDEGAFHAYFVAANSPLAGVRSDAMKVTASSDVQWHVGKTQPALHHRFSAARGPKHNRSMWPDVVIETAEPIGDVVVRALTLGGDTLEVHVVEGSGSPTRSVGTANRGYTLMDGRYAVYVLDAPDTDYQLWLTHKHTKRDALMLVKSIPDDLPVARRAVGRWAPDLKGISQATTNDDLLLLERVFTELPRKLYVTPANALNDVVADARGEAFFPQPGEPLVVTRVFDKGQKATVVSADGYPFDVRIKDLKALPEGAATVPSAPRAAFSGSLSYLPNIAAGKDVAKLKKAEAEREKAAHCYYAYYRDKKPDGLVLVTYRNGQVVNTKNYADLISDRATKKCKVERAAKTLRKLSKKLVERFDERRAESLAKVKTHFAT